MASKVEHHALKIVSESYAKLFLDKEDRGTRQSSRPTTSERKFLQQLHKQMFTGGIRAPVLADVKADFTCRLDIEGTSRTLHKRQKTDLTERKHSFFHVEPEKSSLSLRSTGTPKIYKFLMPNGSLKDEIEEIPVGADKEEWDKWKELVAQKKDARDVLYKNTFCNQKLRYRMLTLPRISTDGNIKHQGDSTGKKPMVLKENTSMDAYVVPQPNRVSYNLKKIQRRRSEKSEDVGSEFFEVRRFKANFDATKGRVEQYTTHVNQPGELFHLTELPSNSKYERPLKNETWKHRPATQGVIRHYIQIPAIPRFGESREKSAQAYRSYLENSQTKNADPSKQAKPLERENTELSMYGYQNRMLQSVIEVNKPDDTDKENVQADPVDDPPNEKEEQLDLSVQDQKDGNVVDNTVDTNRSNKSSKSIVVEIKPTWNEGHEDIPELPSRMEENGNPVPANSPLPDEGIDMDEPDDLNGVDE